MSTIKTMNEATAKACCKKIQEHYPFPECMELSGSNAQKDIIDSLEAKGLVSFARSVRCGFENIEGSYVHLTHKGWELATKY